MQTAPTAQSARAETDARVPEGDTIHRSARTLSLALAGKIITRFASNRILSRDLVGKTIEKVEARGKHLLMRLSDRRAIATHMGMTGSWHIYRPGERWKRPEGMARVVIEVEGYVAVCFSAPTVKLVTAIDETPAVVAHLGPDVLSPEFDRDEAVRRLRALGEAPLGVAIMDQRAVAGVGNIYKSETLFIAGADPFASVSAYDEAALSKILDLARRIMTSNLRGPMRTTTKRHDTGQRFYVYRRKGQGCAKCGTLIEMQRQGEQARSTYYCRSCQRVT